MLMTLLIELLELHWADRKDFYVGGNMFFYYSVLQSKKNDFRGPDFFVVLDTEHRHRDSWVVWEENSQVPSFILEILSPSTEAMDRGEKKRIYERVLRIPEYFLYDPATGALEGYRIGPQRTYEPIQPTAEGRVPSQQLGLLLGTKEGTYLTYQDRWLRFYTTNGALIPTQQEEQARMAEQQAPMAEQLKEYEKRFGPLPPK